MKRLFAGIHWAPDHDNRAVTILELDMPSAAMRIVELESPIATNNLVKLFFNKGLSVIGIDVPFGWPTALSDFMPAWSPNQCSLLHPLIDDLRWRATDRFVKSETAPYKFAESCASDVNVLRTNTFIELCKGQGWMQQIDVVGKLTDDDGRPTVIETSHEATLRALKIEANLDGNSTNGSADGTRTESINNLLQMFKIRKNEKHLAALASDARLAKSFVAATTGILYWSDTSDTVDGASVVLKFGVGIEKPREQQLDKSKREGWIFFPRKV